MENRIYEIRVNVSFKPTEAKRRHGVYESGDRVVQEMQKTN